MQYEISSLYLLYTISDSSTYEKLNEQNLTRHSFNNKRNNVVLSGSFLDKSLLLLIKLFSTFQNISIVTIFKKQVKSLKKIVFYYNNVI